MDYNSYSPLPRQPNPPRQSKGMSIAAMVLGIVGLCGGSIPYVSAVTGICSILAIIFGVLARKKAALYGEATGMATAGLVMGIIGVALTVLSVICLIACLSTSCAAFNSTVFSSSEAFSSIMENFAVFA